jgi:hypothetical protein
MLQDKPQTNQQREANSTNNPDTATRAAIFFFRTIQRV